jgi:tol-pal system protein YbgF
MFIPTGGAFRRTLWTAGIGLALAGCVTTGRFRQFEQRVQTQDQATQTSLASLREEARKTQKLQADIRADIIDLRTEFQDITGQISSGQHDTNKEARERQALENSLAMQLSHLQTQLQAEEARLARIEKYLGLKPLPPPPPPKPSEGAPQEAVPGLSSSSVPGAAPLEAPSASAPAQPDSIYAPAEASSASPAAPAAEVRPEEGYEVAYNLFKAGKYEKARGAFEEFVRNNPKMSLVGNAVFWIGETYYRTGNYETAIYKYQEVLQKYPKSPKAPDSLLKTGFALEQMGEKQAALAAFLKVEQQYPKSSQVDLARKKIQELKATPAVSQKDRGNEVQPKTQDPATRKKSPEKQDTR